MLGRVRLAVIRFARLHTHSYTYTVQAPATHRTQNAFELGTPARQVSEGRTEAQAHHHQSLFLRALCPRWIMRMTTHAGHRERCQASTRSTTTRRRRYK